MLWRGRTELPREVGILAVVAFVVALGFGIVAPAIPLYARSFGVGTTAVGLAVSAFAFFRFVSAFGGGSLVERFGERTVLSAGLAIVAVTTGLAGLAASFPLFLALRAAGGVPSWREQDVSRNRSQRSRWPSVIPWVSRHARRRQGCRVRHVTPDGHRPPPCEHPGRAVAGAGGVAP